MGVGVSVPGTPAPYRDGTDEAADAGSIAAAAAVSRPLSLEERLCGIIVLVAVSKTAAAWLWRRLFLPAPGDAGGVGFVLFLYDGEERHCDCKVH